MGDFIDEFNAMKIQIAKAIASGDTATLHKKIHIVIHDQEKKRKATNPNQSVRIVLNCRTPDAWKQFQAAKERYFDIAVDPHLAIDLIVRALQQPTDELIRAWLAEGNEEEIPEWARG